MAIGLTNVGFNYVLSGSMSRARRRLGRELTNSQIRRYHLVGFLDTLFSPGYPCFGSIYEVCYVFSATMERKGIAGGGVLVIGVIFVLFPLVFFFFFAIPVFPIFLR